MDTAQKPDYERISITPPPSKHTSESPVKQSENAKVKKKERSLGNEGVYGCAGLLGTWVRWTRGGGDRIVLVGVVRAVTEFSLGARWQDCAGGLCESSLPSRQADHSAMLSSSSSSIVVIHCDRFVFIPTPSSLLPGMCFYTPTWRSRLPPSLQPERWSGEGERAR